MVNLKNMHEITPHTLAVLAASSPDGKRARMLEEKDEIFIEHSPSKIVDYACKFFGSSLKGRQEGTADVCGVTHKAPIAVNPSTGMYFFPTASPSNPACSWIAHSHIDHIHSAMPNSTRVIFKNGVEIVLPVSHGSILNQVQRTAQFRYLLDHRIKYMAQSNAGLVAEHFA